MSTVYFLNVGCGQPIHLDLKNFKVFEFQVVTFCCHLGLPLFKTASPKHHDYLLLWTTQKLTCGLDTRFYDLAVIYDCFSGPSVKLPVLQFAQESEITLRAMREFSGLSLTVMVSLYSATRSLSRGLFTCTTPVWQIKRERGKPCVFFGHSFLVITYDQGTTTPRHPFFSPCHWCRRLHPGCQQWCCKWAVHCAHCLHLVLELWPRKCVWVHLRSHWCCMAGSGELGRCHWCLGHGPPPPPKENTSTQK